MSFDLGSRFRSIRRMHGLSQRQLARKTGVSHATISLIEQNRTSPSVSILMKLLNGIPISFGDFWSLDVETKEDVFYGADDLIKVDNGKIIYWQIGGNSSARTMLVQYERYQPGADSGDTLLSHESEEAGFVIKGRIELTVGDRRRVLGPGDAYYFDSRVPHRFRNIGHKDCDLVSTCTPPSF